jgi:dTDP-4-dehydrorhamnose reductase
MRVLVLGALGLLGHTVCRILGQSNELNVFGTVRRKIDMGRVEPALRSRVVAVKDLCDLVEMKSLIAEVQPKLVINCLSLPKNLQKDQLACDRLYVEVPRTLASSVDPTSTRIISISSDGVFSGKRCNYKESDEADDNSVYGKAKLKGEVVGPNILNLRLSMLGHSFDGTVGFLDWFLAQNNECTGFTNSVFSGLPTYHISKVLQEIIIPNDRLSGVYHLGAQAISKFDLLQLINSQYKKELSIKPVSVPEVDRSLNSDKFTRATGWTAPAWSQLVEEMSLDHRDSHPSV